MPPATLEEFMARKPTDILFRLGRLRPWVDYELLRPQPDRLLLLRLNLLRLRLSHRLVSLKLRES
jgi:hypothetical protein